MAVQRFLLWPFINFDIFKVVFATQDWVDCMFCFLDSHWGKAQVLAWLCPPPGKVLSHPCPAAEEATVHHDSENNSRSHLVGGQRKKSVQYQEVTLSKRLKISLYDSVFLSSFAQLCSLPSFLKLAFSAFIVLTSLKALPAWRV